MSGAAQRGERPEQEMLLGTGTDGPVAGGGGAGLKQMAAERLAEHRRRREAAAASQAEQEARLRARMEAAKGVNGGGVGGTSRVREAVAERYRQSVSYREFLAAEAERALEKAQAEAEVAARSARAVAQAQMELLEELELWKTPVSGPQAVGAVAEAAGSKTAGPQMAGERREREAKRELAHALADIALGAQELALEPAAKGEAPLLNVVEAMPTPEHLREFASGLKVRLHEELGPVGSAGTQQRRVYGPWPEQAQVEEMAELGQQIEELEREIEFRLAPEFQTHVIEMTPIQANIIEFPRQLVAPRKARPRLAEGPLREDGTPEPQLRIFEVEAEQISAEPVMEATPAPEWQSLLLDAHVPGPMPEAVAEARTAPQTAPVGLRAMAALVDVCCVGVGFVGFAVAAAEVAGPALRGVAMPMLGVVGAVALAVFAAIYQVLFFTLNEATPGMRYARVGLCTFTDRNPTRRAMRRRLVAMAIAVSPLGLGLVWMVLDQDRLGWHDRMSKMYPRAY